MPGEFDFIQWLKAQQKPSAFAQLGIGDDMAILRWPPNDLLLVGADQVLDGVHFDSAIHSPRQIGRKVMNRNLSDCAAMACLPAAAVATVALPHGADIEYAKELYLGLCEAADPFDCAIIGGDTASWPGKLAMTVTIFGRSDGVAPVLRSGAKVGDAIFVTGALGGSILGRHMTFEPQVRYARQLSAFASSMIDLSDGLSRDLKQICDASKVGAIVFANQIPIHDDAQEMFRRDRISPLQHALNDGEDYELLFTSRPENQFLYVRVIGSIMAEPGIRLMNDDGSIVPLEPGGWEHAL